MTDKEKALQLTIARNELVNLLKSPYVESFKLERIDELVKRYKHFASVCIESGIAE